MNYKLGKAPARRDNRTLRLAAYTAGLVPAPAICDLTSKMSNLGMMLNDSLGDCTCATVGHIIQQWTAANGDQIIVPDTAILSLYEIVGGYKPGDVSTDNGAVIMDVLNYWKKNTIASNALSAYAYANSKRIQEVKDSIYYFGAAYAGVQLPLSVQDLAEWVVPTEGLTGDGIPGSWGGHAIPLVAYDEATVTCITWGSLLKMTWDFFVNYADEVYALLSPDWIATGGKSPEGFDTVALNGDLVLITA